MRKYLAFLKQILALQYILEKQIGHIVLQRPGGKFAHSKPHSTPVNQSHKIMSSNDLTHPRANPEYFKSRRPIREFASPEYSCCSRGFAN
jgi:hypothetical protein